MELENTTTHWLPPNYPECPENDHQDVKLLDSFGFWMEGVAQTSIAIGMDWVYVQRRASERVAYNSRLRLYSMEKKSTKVEFPPYRVKMVFSTIKCRIELDTLFKNHWFIAFTVASVTCDTAIEREREFSSFDNLQELISCDY